MRTVASARVQDGKFIPLEGVNLLKQLPPEISDKLFANYQQPGKDGLEVVIAHFKAFSFVSQVLMRDPGTFEMLESIYTGRGLQGVIDKYYFRSRAGQALRNRLSSIIMRIGEMIEAEVEEKGRIKVVNLGSGTARDTIGILAANPGLAGRLSVDCVDLNQRALRKGQELANESGLGENFVFTRKNLLALPYRGEVDIGLLIGILCSLDHKTCVTLLRKIRPYFKKGGMLVASNVLVSMPAEDPFTSYLLKHVIRWELVYKTSEELRQIFEKAGYRWVGIFYDEPTRFHGMGIAMV